MTKINSLDCSFFSRNKQPPYCNLNCCFWAFWVTWVDKAGYLDAVNGLVAYVFPGLWWIHELSVLDLVFNVHVFVERKLPAQRHIDDDPSGPHVKGPVEPFLLQQPRVQDFRGQVRWSANDRFPEGLFPNNPRVSKVTQLNLFYII